VAPYISLQDDNIDITVSVISISTMEQLTGYHSSPW